MQLRHITVEKTARYYTLGKRSLKNKRIFFLLHGYGQSAKAIITSFLKWDQAENLLIAPEGLSRFYYQVSKGDKVGACWMTKEDRLAEICDYIKYLDKVYSTELTGNLENVKIYCLGFSQGVATGTRWIYNTSKRFDGMINFSGTPAIEINWNNKQNQISRIRHLYITGKHDELIPELIMESIKKTLTRNQVDVELLNFDGKHEITSQAVDMVMENVLKRE